MRRVFVCVWLCACAPIQPSMADLSFPVGYQLTTFTDVALRIDAPSPRPGGRLEVRLADGELLADQELAVALAHPPVLRVPGATRVLEVTLRQGATAHVLHVPIEGDVARVELP